MDFGEFKKLDYSDNTPMEFALVASLKDGLIDVNEVLSAYTRAIEIERHQSAMMFEEACTCIMQHLCGNFKGEHEANLNKRMVHISNLSKSLPSHIYDKAYGYTKEDEEEYDRLCKTLYGITL